MTIGEAIRAERESKGWTVEEMAGRLGPAYDIRYVLGMETFEGAGLLNGNALLDLRQIGIDPIGRMVEAERLAEAVNLLLPDAKWRADPVEAARAVVDGVWEEDCIGWELRSRRVAGYILDTRHRGEFCVHSGFNGDSEVIRMCRDSGSREAASVVLIESILKGIITLPAVCPGVAALLEMEEAE